MIARLDPIFSSLFFLLFFLGSGVKVTTLRRTLADGQVVMDTTEQVTATKTDKIVARVVLLVIFLFLAKLTWMLQLWSF